MTKGIRTNYGETLGKTIIFAKNHDHAEKILEIFGKEYPNLPRYAKVIDNYPFPRTDLSQINPEEDSQNFVLPA